MQAAEAAAGRFQDRVACLSDPTQTYTLYTPPGYPSNRRWPVLLVFDPRGRGRVAAEIYREAADAHGWLLISSDNTSSDGPMAPNVKAVNAIWQDVHGRYPIDEHRLYASGFSGTVVVAWGVASSTGELAGIIAVGGPMRPQITAKGEGFALFAAAGRHDFNLLEMQDLMATLKGRAVPRRLEVFAGDHEWLTPALATTALGWFEVLAMKQGTRPRDEALVARLLEAERAESDALERDGYLAEAAARRGAIIETFSELSDVGPDRARLQELTTRKDFVEAERRNRQVEEWERAFRRQMTGAITHVLESEEVAGVAQAANQLRVPTLRERLRRPAPEGDAAARVLNLLGVQLSYYRWASLMAEGAFRRAAFLQEVAAEVWPDSPVPYYRLAISRTRSGETKRALDALEEAVARGMRRLEALDDEPAFAPLRADPRFLAIRERVRQASASG